MTSFAYPAFTKDALFYYCSFMLASLVLIRANQPVQCPIQCVCVPNGMSCELPGLNRIPPPYSNQLEYLIVENQTFANTHLGPSELISYKTPEFGGKVRLKRFYIRWCNIETIGRNAFESLGSRLEMIDLTGNPLKQIGGYAFAGLKPLTLILDKISQPLFDPHVFSGLEKMKSLFIRNSEFTTLPFEPLLRLTADGNLDQLLLKGNQLHTLPEKYDRIFGALQEFEVHENPWHCDCHLTWLIRRYQSISARRRPKYKNSKRSWSITPTWDNWEQEDKQPKCASPSNVNGRNFSELITNIHVASDLTGYKHAPTILYCPPPVLERFDLNIGNYFRPTIHSSSAEQTSNPSVQVSCVMRGSEMLQLSWRNHIPGLGALTIPELNITSHKSGLVTTELVPWSMRGNEIFRTESMLNIEKHGDTESYSCLGGDVMGNVSAHIRIHWPKIDEKKYPINSSTTSSPKTLKSNHNNPPVEGQPEALIEPSSVLHTPQFTLGQLLAAVIGTFVCTVLLFCLIHYTLHYPCIKCVGDEHSETAKTKIGSVGLSPGGTSSSNTSSNNPNLLSSPQVPDLYPPTILTNTLCPDLLSLQAFNLLNAHTYHQFLNGGIGYQQTHQGIGPTIPASNPNNLPNDMNRQNQLYTGPPEHRAQSMLSTYEPVSYSEANNHITYDIPCLTNTNHILGQLVDNQRVPLLLGNRQNETTLNFRDLNKPIWHPGLLIPPPPSIPQPALPPTPNSSVGSMFNTLNRTYSTSTTPNLLVLQSTAHTLLPPPSVESITPSSSATTVLIGT